MRFIIWLTIFASGVLAYVLMLSESVSLVLRHIFAWYSLAILIVTFAVVGITLSVRFRRLDPEDIWVLRFFDLWS
jgi:cation transporter-like permease